MENRKKRIVIIADDLTGANDTGAQFAKQGLDTLVILKPEQAAFSADSDTIKNTGCEVIVLDTGSRALPAAVAYQKVAAVARLIKKTGYDLIYKKVDSTLRGNLGCEIDAIMDECGIETAIVAPAFPKTGRTTVNRVHLLKGIPLEDTEISRDPKCPVHESDIVKLLSGQTKRTIGHIGIKEMKQGREAVGRAVKEMCEKNIGVIVADIWLDGQFELLVGAAAEVNKNILWVGSAGLAEVMPDLLGIKPHPAAKPVVVVAGSVSNVTRGQVSLLAKEANTELIELDAVKLLGPAADKHIEECRLMVKAALGNNRDAVLVSGYDDDIVAATKRQGAALGLQSAKVSDIVGESLGKIINMVMADKPDISGIILTGGDTAVSVCQSLAAYGLKIASEVATAIPLGFLQGGCCHGLPVVTKAGAFGDEDALKKAVACLKTRNL